MGEWALEEHIIRNEENLKKKSRTSNFDSWMKFRATKKVQLTNGVKDHTIFWIYVTRLVAILSKM